MAGRSQPALLSLLNPYTLSREGSLEGFRPRRPLILPSVNSAPSALRSPFSPTTHSPREHHPASSRISVPFARSQALHPPTSKPVNALWPLSLLSQRARESNKRANNPFIFIYLQTHILPTPFDSYSYEWPRVYSAIRRYVNQEPQRKTSRWDSQPLPPFPYAFCIR
jgi:hypothetical protein